MPNAINVSFDTMQDAFAFCRECDRVVTVNVQGTIWKLFPSGKALKLKDKPCIEVTISPKA